MSARTGRVPSADAAAAHLAGFHAVREALRAGAPLRFVAFNRERRDPRAAELLAQLRAAGVAVRFETAAALDRLAPGQRHQGVVAVAEAKATLALEDLLPQATAGLLIACDGIEDPQNLGAIVRSASAAGADGLLLPQRRSAGLSAVVERVSAGALQHLPVARVPNLVQALDRCRQLDWWTVGLHPDAPTSIWQHDFRPRTVLVVGAEGRGLHQLTRQRCDVLVSIPMASAIGSLNAAAASAIALFELRRQRTASSRGNLDAP
ncbi:MAG: 23S rRNA (guanosine(2251)-2'-O)-methyltransferase RlmB [Terriglobales bacterium]